MKFNKSVSNPMLVGSIELLRAEDTPEHRQMLEDEIFKGEYLSPALVEPEPEENAQGELVIKPGSQIQFPMLTAPDGKKFFMAFTDKSEYEKLPNNNAKYTFAITFGDYMNMLFRKGPDGQLPVAAGFVINPFGGNIALPKEIAMAIFTKRMPKMPK